MLAVLKRDLRGYFTSPIGFVFIAAFLAVLNSYFYINNILSATSDIASLFGFIRFILIFTVPILTMRLFSEEYKQKTDQLLLTSPNSIFGIVFGKFFAALAMFSVVILFSLLYLVIIAAYGQPNVKQVLANYIAIYCVAAAFISIGLFLSSLTENQLISAVLALAVFLGLYLVDYSGIGYNNIIINNFLYAISMFRRYENISRGVLAINDLIYYISVAAIFLFLTTRVIEKKRWS
jgi:ABC-2 type transport system permease protein